MEAAKATEALERLRRVQADHELSIIKLGELIASAAAHGPRQCGSGASNASLDAPTPASLESDLAHYAELFAKLRFSYVEQVTKEKFIRAIVGDPPLIVSVQEILDLEKANGEAKAQLKLLKLEVTAMVAELERKARDLSQRHERLRLQKGQLADLPSKITALEAQVEHLLAAQAAQPGIDPDLNLPLNKTLVLLAQRKTEQQELARELEALQARVPRKAKEADRLRAELQPLETRLQNSTAASREAQRKKEAGLGGVADDLEQRARWWRASESVLRQMLDVENYVPPLEATGEEGR